MNALVAGGAGFLGSHLCERLVKDGWHVQAVDSMFSGRHSNIARLMDDPNFEFARADITKGIPEAGMKLDVVFHLASIASPSKYRSRPIHTMHTGSAGTEECLKLARYNRAVMVLASTSEVYGNPAVHPQPEWYNGNVDPVGPRSMYDESKRYAEALVRAYGTEYGVEGRIARIFNTYGPRMRLDDGRVVSTFIRQALLGQPLTVEGTGTQTRTLCYVSDLVDGLVQMATVAKNSDPINIGGVEELSVWELAELIRDLVESKSEIVHVDEAPGDPERRRPLIDKAMKELDWHPVIPLVMGLSRTIAWAKEEIEWMR